MFKRDKLDEVYIRKKILFLLQIKIKFMVHLRKWCTLIFYLKWQLFYYEYMHRKLFVYISYYMVQYKQYYNNNNSGNIAAAT